MSEIRLQKVVEKNGEVIMTGLPYKKGQNIEVTLFTKPQVGSKRSLTASKLLNSELAGLWENRKDIENTVFYARQLREQAQNRSESRI
ncbi:hypothetical protein M1N64_02415 [Peptococcaceae bacterium]|nr:hypothetical protein [Peptococcaceae bacterium]